MTVILKDDRRYVVRFDKGEDIMQKLGECMQEQNIGACTFTGIGACSEAELGFYNPPAKEYRRKPFFQAMELLSLVGNGLTQDGSPVIHAHAVLADGDFNVVGGHAFKLVISATCELFLIKLDGQLQRQHNEENNLNLLV